MKILAIESSCDETSAAIVEQEGEIIKLISQSTATSLALHSKTGGIIPEIAAREQSKYIIPVITDALEKAHISFEKNSLPDIDAIAVTYGPGLIGSLLVGVETAKVLSLVWKKPLFPVNHLFGHIYANFIQIEESNKNIEFPLIALVVSGGHTDLVLMKSHKEIVWLGGTRDDAAGECFDKTGRLLGFAYPAGPEIEKHAKAGNAKAFHFPRPLKNDSSFDFSFSGLKTAVLREVEKTQMLDEKTINNICRGLQDAIIEVLISKTLQAAEKYNVKSVLLSGGVAANQTLSDAFVKATQEKRIAFHVPPRNLCTDNAAMIGAAAFFQSKKTEAMSVAANPELYFD